jgi:hypothetical protein
MSASDAEHNGSSSRMDESSDVAEPAAAAAAEARPAASAATAAVPAAIAAATAADDEGGAMATEGAAVTDEGDDSASAESQRVLEEYRVWKKNAPFLCQFFKRLAQPQQSAEGGSRLSAQLRGFTVALFVVLFPLQTTAWYRTRSNGRR